MGRNFSRRVASALAGVLIAVVAAGAAVAAPPAPVGVEIRDARVERDLPGKSISQTFAVTNHESAPRRITMSVSGLGHDLDGNPEFLEPAPATDALQLDATSFVLNPGQRKDVHATGSIPPAQRSLYASVIAEYAPLEQPSGTVESHSRVASLLLFRGPKPWSERVSVEDVGLLPGHRPGTYSVFAALKNTGDVHIRPTGTARIVKDGTVLATVPLTAQLVLPGFTRRISGTWTPASTPSGTVQIHVTTQPPASGSGTANLSGSGGAGRPQAEIVNLRGHDESGAYVTMTVVNTGKVPVAPAVTVFATQEGTERARTILTPGTIAPGKSADLEWRPGLDDGVYLVTAQARSKGVLLDQASTALKLGGVGVGTQGTARAPARKSALVGIAATLLALCAVALFLLSRRRPRPPAVATEEHRPAAAA